MLIPIQYLVSKYNLKISGIVHVGANYGQEIKSYNEIGVSNIIWVEAIIEVYQVLCEKLQPYPASKCFLVCVSNEDGKPVSFNVTNNKGQNNAVIGCGS